MGCGIDPIYPIASTRVGLAASVSDVGKDRLTQGTQFYLKALVLNPRRGVNIQAIR